MPVVFLSVLDIVASISFEVARLVATAIISTAGEQTSCVHLRYLYHTTVLILVHTTEQR